MSCLEINRAGDAAAQCFFPTRHADAPFVTRLKPGKFPLWVRCDQVVSLQHRKIEKVASHLRTNGVQPNVAGPGATVAVAIEAGEWIAAATLQLGAEDICGHRKRIMGCSFLSSQCKPADPVGKLLR